MSTSDGISTSDWDVVHQLSVDIVNAPDDQKEEARQRLFQCLERLEDKYGPLPSIVATKADYTDDDDIKQCLLNRAFELAASRNDHTNLAYVAQSLAEFFIERRYLDQADRWLTISRQHSREAGDSFSAMEYERLRAEYRRLIIDKAE